MSDADLGASSDMEDTAPNPDKDWEAEAKKWKTLARKHEQNAKANSGAADKLTELEEAGKSEQQKLSDKLAEAERRARDAELKADRLEVAITKGLDEAQSKRLMTATKRLVGATKEEIEADADDFLPSFMGASAGDQDTKTPPAPTPQQRLKGGGDPTTESVPDIRQIVADIPRGF
jgi:hypothetical protein